MQTDLFAGVAVTDFDRAVAWYERLLGRPASMQPHDTESVWEMAEHAYLYVVLQPDDAGHSLVTAFLGDLDAFIASAALRGVHPDEDETYDNGVRKISYRDPDGNAIGFGGGPTGDDADSHQT